MTGNVCREEIKKTQKIQDYGEKNNFEPFGS